MAPPQRRWRVSWQHQLFAAFVLVLLFILMIARAPLWVALIPFAVAVLLTLTGTRQLLERSGFDPGPRGWQGLDDDRNR